MGSAFIISPFFYVTVALILSLISCFESHEELVVGKEALDIMQEDSLSRQLYMLLRDGKRWYFLILSIA